MNDPDIIHDYVEPPAGQYLIAPLKGYGVEDDSNLTPRGDADLVWYTNSREQLARRVIFVRHGRTHYNAIHRIQGMVDIPLDAKGMWQVTETGKELRRLYVDTDEAREQGIKQFVLASDLTRAAQTAHAFADPLGLDVHFDTRVRERYFGEWEAKSQKELMENYPEDFRGWLEGKGSELVHGAESKQHTGARGAEAVNEWAQKLDSSTDLYVFSHGSLIAQTIQYLLGKGTDGVYESLGSMRNAYWAILEPVVRSDGSYRWRLLEFNHAPRIAEQGNWNGEMTPSGLS